MRISYFELASSARFSGELVYRLLEMAVSVAAPNNSSSENLAEPEPHSPSEGRDGDRPIASTFGVSLDYFRV